MLQRQRSPLSAMFSPNLQGTDGLDASIIDRIHSEPGISVTNIQRSILLHNPKDPTEAAMIPYHLIRYRIATLEDEGLIYTKREPQNKRERRCYLKND